MKNRGFVWIVLLLFLPGLLLFQCWPLVNVLVQSFEAPEQFRMLLQEESFLLALKNTVVFSICAITGIHLISFGLALTIYRAGKALWAQTMLILPLAIPMIATTSVWKGFLQDHAATVLYGPWAFPLMLILFWWKYAGFHTLVYVAGLRSVHPAQLEAARLDGAALRQQVFRIFLPQMTSFIVFNTIFALSESFRIFRDLYLLFGNYPPRPVYLLQHYIQNHYTNLQGDRIFPAAAVFFTVTLLVLVPLLRRMRREEDDLAAE